MGVTITSSTGKGGIGASNMQNQKYVEANVGQPATAGEVLTEREVARRARRARWQAAHRAGDPRVAGDAIAFLHAAHVLAGLDDGADDLVAEHVRKGDHRRHRVVERALEVRLLHVAAADAAVARLDDHPVVAEELRVRHVFVDERSAAREPVEHLPRHETRIRKMERQRLHRDTARRARPAGTKKPTSIKSPPDQPRCCTPIWSSGFGALPRLVMGAAKNEAHAGEDKPDRVMVRIKSNIGPSGGGFGYCAL